MILVALGANVPIGAMALEGTLYEAIEAMPRYGLRPMRVSSFYTTPAITSDTQPDFVNAVMSVRTCLSPAATLTRLHALELAFGRVRTQQKNAPRTLDLDLLDYHGICLTRPLCLPHPRLHLRGFVLYPLREIVPCWRHPISGVCVDDLIRALPPKTRLKKTACQV